MSLPLKVKNKYIGRLEELIQQGQKLPLIQKSKCTGGNYLSGEKTYKHYEVVSWPEFVEWRTSCTTLLDQIIPKNNVHRSTVDNLITLSSKPDELEFATSFLKSIKCDLESGFLESIALEIEAELTADYIGQAERLLSGETSGKYSHIPAAVLAGAVLEKTLKTICNQLSPPESVINDKGAPIKLNGLIDTLKKRNVYNELVAKQLRAWADIRNKAAHGDFDEFTKNQVESMISGVSVFLSQNL